VYPFVDGTPLRDFLNASGPLPLAAAGQIIAAIGQGLEALHERRIVYGILSPEHIVVTQEHGKLSAVLLNAGAFRVSGTTSTSPGYLAPEQASGNPTLASDVFSLGAVAAEILTGRRVFRYGSLSELTRLQRIGVARGSLRKLRHKIPQRVEEELRRALSWDAAHRPSDIAVFGRRLLEYLGAEGLFPKRRLFLLGAAGLAMAVLGLRRCRSHGLPRLRP
jgi:serine/threonine protein kinase